MTNESEPRALSPEDLAKIAARYGRLKDSDEPDSMLARCYLHDVTRLLEHAAALADRHAIDAMEAASHALRSYQYGNASPDLAKQTADALDEVIAAMRKAGGHVG